MKVTQTPEDSPEPRQPYVKPELSEYGSVAELTALTGAAMTVDSPLPGAMGSV